MIVRRYSVITAMDGMELVEKVNSSIEQHNGTLLGGVAARGAQLLQALMIDVNVPDPEPEEDEETSEQGTTTEATTAASKKKGTKKQQKES